MKRLDPEYLRGLSDYADKQMSEAFGDAADEIERLRARLAEIEDRPPAADLWVEKLRCFNPLTGRRDGGYCVWEGQGKCLYCEAADEIERLRAERNELRETVKVLDEDAASEILRLRARLAKADSLLATIRNDASRLASREMADLMAWGIEIYFADWETE